MLSGHLISVMMKQTSLQGKLFALSDAELAVLERHTRVRTSVVEHRRLLLAIEPSLGHGQDAVLRKFRKP
jgi:hypothetical protein